MAPAGGAANAYVYLKQRKSREKDEKTGKADLRRCERIQLYDHNDVGRKIEEWGNNG